MEYIDRNPGNSDRACRKRWKENLPKKRREGKKKMETENVESRFCWLG